MKPSFTAVYTHSNRPIPCLSPSHNTIITTSSSKSSHIRSTRSLATLSILTSSATPRVIRYAPDGTTVLVLLSNPSVIDVYDISNENSPKKVRRIRLAPPRPFTRFVFSPDSSGFLTFSEFSLHSTYWDLTTSPTTSPPVLTQLKSPLTTCFNPAKPNIFAAICRVRCKDRLNIYVAPSLTLLLSVLIPTQDAKECMLFLFLFFLIIFFFFNTIVLTFNYICIYRYVESRRSTLDGV